MTTQVPQLTVANWLRPEMIHRSFQRVDEFLPTVALSRGDGAAAAWPVHFAGLEEWTVSPEHGTVADVLRGTEADAWLVLHRGRIIAEGYVRPMTAGSRHLLMSVSKSITSLVVGALVDRGVLDVAELVTAYVPDLAGSGYAGAILRDVLDMRTGIGFSEDYFDPDSGAAHMDAAVGWARRQEGGPTTLKQLLRQLEADREHGGYFEYRSCETNVLGWICEAATGRKFHDLAAELVWSRLGAQADATLCVDAEGTSICDGGYNATLRDVARFGATVLAGGIAPSGQRVVSHAWIDDIFAPNDELTHAFSSGPNADYLPGGRYRGQFWVAPGSDVVICVGIHGQFVYIDRSADMVAVQLSSWPVPLDPERVEAVRSWCGAVADRLAPG